MDIFSAGCMIVHPQADIVSCPQRKGSPVIYTELPRM
jgi:hypothetical protein